MGSGSLSVVAAAAFSTAPAIVFLEGIDVGTGIGDVPEMGFAVG